MVKLDVQVLRYLSAHDWRTLVAVEMGMKNHDMVPTVLVSRVAGIKGAAAHRALQNLHKFKLVFHSTVPYDGYRLTYVGYDFLAVHAFVQRGLISGLGCKLGVGKESDVYEAVNEKGDSLVVKFHRLGRTSFRAIKEKRDYHQNRQSASWLYLSRLAAIKEFAYMKALFDHGFSVPIPIDHNRHCVLMSCVEGTPLCQLSFLKHPARVFNLLMQTIVRLAEHGLIHCDFNEFNLLVDAEEHVTLIDFPQMVSTSHLNAKELFDRDVKCLCDFFSRKLNFIPDSFPVFEEDTQKVVNLDEQLKASGVNLEELRQLERFLQRNQLTEEEKESNEEEEEEEEEEDDLKAIPQQHEAPDKDEEEEEEEEESKQVQVKPKPLPTQAAVRQKLKKISMKKKIKGYWKKNKNADKRKLKQEMATME